MTSGHSPESTLRMAADRSVLLRCGAHASSGWLLEGYAVAPGLLFTPEQAKAMTSIKNPYSVSPYVTVMLRRAGCKSLGLGTLDALPVAAKTTALTLSTESRELPDEVVYTTAKVVAVWNCEQLASKLDDILHEWKHGLEDLEDGSDREVKALGSSEVHYLASLFMLLRLECTNLRVPPRDVLSDALQLVPEMPPRGTPVCLASAPLGSTALLGAVNLGVVSGASPGGLLVLTDARAAPNSEGAPLYVLRGGAVVALVLSPLTWWRGEAVGFTLCVPLRQMLSGALRQLAPSHPAPLRGIPSGVDREEKRRSLGKLAGVDGGVVLVRCGLLWGSGFLVDKEKGLVVTCSHVVGQDASTASVRWGEHSMKADVVWWAKSGDPFDVAVLKLHSHPRVQDMLALTLDPQKPVLGETVFAVGFPLFPESMAPGGWAMQPLVSRGHVAAWWPAARSQIISSCSVQSGASGGPLVRISEAGDAASVIGILVCTAQVGTGKDSVVYPNVNLAIWSQAIAEPLRRYLQSEDVSELDDLCCKSAATHRQWKLEPPAMSKL